MEFRLVLFLSKKPMFVIHWINGGKEYDYGFANTIINHLCTGSIGSRFILFVFHFGDSGAWPSGRPGILAFDAIDQSCHSESFILCQFSWFTLCPSGKCLAMVPYPRCRQWVLPPSGSNAPLLHWCFHGHRGRKRPFEQHA